MSSTDPSLDGELHAFFAQRLAPAAEALRQRGVRFFETAPDAAAPSYYVDHAATPDPFAELEPGRFAELLKAHWAGQQLPELAELAEPLMALAPRVGPKQEDAGDVSPFIYVMF